MRTAPTLGTIVCSGIAAAAFIFNDPAAFGLFLVGALICAAFAVWPRQEWRS